MDLIRIAPPASVIRGRIRLPASKSISNRALVLRWLSGGRIRVSNLSGARDTVLLNGLLSVAAKNLGGASETELHCENAGTVIRFLTALLAATPGKWLLSGTARMEERPIGPLVSALRELGASISFPGREGYPPLLIEGRPLHGGRISIEAGISSQFITALLMMAPTLPGGLELRLEGHAGSRPYIGMTMAMLRMAGIRVSEEGNVISVPCQDLEACEFEVEPDWSSAAFWYEALALAGRGELLLEGLRAESLQGDSVLPELFGALGIDSEQEGGGIRIRAGHRPAAAFTHDFTHQPDLAQAVAATCAGLGTGGRLRGLESLRIKETDRLEALRTELSKTGILPTIVGDSELVIPPFSMGRTAEPVMFSSHDDHRMAMAMAPLCLRLGEVSMGNPQAIVKSYPGYWDDMAGKGFQINRS